MKWKTRDGQVMEISEMADGHLLNSIKLVKRRIEDRFVQAFPLDDFVIPQHIFDKREKMFKQSLMADRSYVALVNEAVRRRRMDMDGNPLPWERSPFSDPPKVRQQEKANDSYKVKVTQQKKRSNSSVLKELMAKVDESKRRADLARTFESYGSSAERESKALINAAMDRLEAEYKEKKKEDKKKQEETVIDVWKPGKRRIIID